MRIGIDFDNTIISYDQIFNKTAAELDLIPDGLAEGKNSVRDYLRKTGKEKDWTRLQGYVYGTGLGDARPYAGVKQFILFCKKESIPVFIVSHKTKYPYSKEKYNLHEAANKWISDQQIECPVFFEPSREDKIKRINRLNCTHFIDDLPEFLSLPGFGQNVIKILFDPHHKFVKNKQGRQYRFSSWHEILYRIKADAVSHIF